MHGSRKTSTSTPRVQAFREREKQSDPLRCYPVWLRDSEADRLAAQYDAWEKYQSRIKQVRNVYRERRSA